MASLLSATILMPLAGALLLGKNPRGARRLAMLVTMLTLAAAVVLLVNRPDGDQPFADVSIGLPGQSGVIGPVRFELSLDGLSSWLMALTAMAATGFAFLGPKAEDGESIALLRLLLLLESSTLATLAIADAVLFCFFCELTMLLLMITIGTGGGKRANSAAVRFISLSTLGGGLVLLGVLAMASWHFRHGPATTATFSMPRLITALAEADDWAVKSWICLSMTVGLIGIGTQFHWHGWVRGGLSTARVNRQSTAKHLLVSCVLLELCAYGILRFVRPIIGDATDLAAALGNLTAGLFGSDETDQVATVADLATPDIFNAFGRWMPWLLGALLLPLFIRSANTRDAAARAGLVLAAIAGAAMSIVADDPERMFLAVQIVAVTVGLLLYIDAFQSKQRRGGEKSLPRRRLDVCSRMNSEYLLPSILASAILLGGFAMLHADGTHSAATVKIGLAMVLAALGFTVAAVPFHFHFPHILGRSSYANGTLLSVVAKMAGLVVMARVLSGVAAVTNNGEVSVWPAAGLLSAATMGFGGFMALRQDHLRPLLAYVSIVQTGTLLMALVTASVPGGPLPANWNPIATLLFCLCVYSVGTIGTLAVLTHLRRDDRSLMTVEELAGLARGRPMAAAVLAVSLSSMAGIAPLVGFWGKAMLIGGLLAAQSEAGQPWLIVLAVVGICSMAAMTACCMRIVAVMYFRAPLAVPKPTGGPAAWCVATTCAALLLIAAILAGPLADMVRGNTNPKRELGGKQVNQVLEPGIPCSTATSGRFSTTCCQP